MNSVNKIRTTINFMKERHDLLLEISNNNSIHYKVLIKRCIDCFIIDFDKGKFNESALKYQEDNNEWKKVHFQMLPHEYDVYFDLKKVCRCSFSLIVAIAIDRYLQHVLRGYQEDSYPLNDYTKLCILDEEYPIYLFSWKKTEKFEEVEALFRE
jgi:hypothetical protein